MQQCPLSESELQRTVQALLQESRNNQLAIRDLGAKLNGISGRLDFLEHLLDSSAGNHRLLRLEGSQSQLRAELTGVHRATTDVVEVANRLEPEVKRLLKWCNKLSAGLKEAVQQVDLDSLD